MKIENIVAGRELNVPLKRSLRKQKVVTMENIAGRELNNSEAKTSLRKQKVRGERKIKNWYCLSEALGIAACIGLVGYVLLKTPVSNFVKEKRLEKEYGALLAQYGDRNDDGFVDKQVVDEA